MNPFNNLPRFFRFILVGFSNTAITLTVITLFTLLVPRWYLWGNILGYALGLINSFFWNKTFTFESRGKWHREAGPFLLLFALCYGAQLGITTAAIRFLALPLLPAQFAGMVFYTVSNYALNKRITFAQRGNDAEL